MADYLVTDSELTSIADAIRTKGGTSAALSFPTEFVSAIGDIGSNYTWFGANPVLLAENEVIRTLNDTNYSSWTPSTTQHMLSFSTAFNLLSFQGQPDYDLYDLALIIQLVVDIKYASGTEMKAAARAYLYNLLYFHGKYFSALTDFNSGNPSSTTYKSYNDYHLFYYNPSGTLGVASWGYGPAYTTTVPSLTSGSMMTFKPPTLYARCNASYFSTTAAAAVDTANTIITFKAKAYQVDKPNYSYQLQKMISDNWRALT